MANKAHLVGTVATEPEFSHESHNNKFWKFFLNVERMSGVNDVIPCILSDINVKDVNNGARVEIFGEIRTRNIHDNAGNKRLEVYCYVEYVCTDVVSDSDVNEVSLDGYIVKISETRKTSKGRIIKDMIIASNRENNYRSDYIPCIAWGKRTHDVEMLNSTNHIIVNGRIQSRNYIKVLDGVEELRTTYELSISTVSFADDGGGIYED